MVARHSCLRTCYVQHHNVAFPHAYHVPGPPHGGMGEVVPTLAVSQCHHVTEQLSSLFTCDTSTPPRSVGKLVHLPAPAPTCGITGRPICMSALCQAQCHSGAAHLFTIYSISKCHTSIPAWCCSICSQACGVAASGSMNTLVHT